MAEPLSKTVRMPATLADWNERGRDYLPGHLGIEALKVEPDEVVLRMAADRCKLSWNGFLHGGAVVALADSACGYATVRNLPADASGFTTVELKTNFLGSTLSGDVICTARPAHRGRTTQVWDAEVTVAATGKTIALFRCTQMILRG